MLACNECSHTSLSGLFNNVKSRRVLSFDASIGPSAMGRP